MTTTAIILAARCEKDTSIPYPLQPLHDKGSECLLSRSIRLIRQVGIKKIVIVVGYKSELFECYKSEDIIILKNNDHMFTSSMSSLATAAPFITEDFILIESDVLFEKRILEALVTTKKKNCLTIVDESGSGDEALVEIDEECVVKISKDIHQFNRINGEMVGISKFSLDALRKMMILWEHNSNLKLNYEYLFMDATGKHEHGFIKFKDVVWCDVDNADNFRHLKNYIYPKLKRREDPYDIQNIVSHIKAIFTDFTDEEPIIVDVIGGMTNRNFKISFRGREYVLRIPGNGTEAMIERIYEGRNTVLSNKLGISPEIRFIDDVTGVKLTDYISGSETLNSATIQRFDNMEKIICILRKLHKSGVRMSNEFNVFREIQKYEKLMHDCGARMYDGYGDVRDQIMRLEDNLNDLGVEICPCHNDLVPENFIKDQLGRVYLIDWEYSGMNDPMWDIAALFLESNFSEESKELFIRKYFGKDERQKSISNKILIYSVLIDILWSIWTVIKEKQGDNFGSYGIDRFTRAMNNLKKLSNEE